MLFSMRLSVPDRPGTLGAVATELSGAGVNIVTLVVLGSQGGIAVDDLTVESASAGATEVRAAAERTAGVIVEAIRPIEAVPDPLALMTLVSEMIASPGESLNLLVDGLPRAMRANWCWVVHFFDGRLDVIAASAGAPSLSNIETPWLPLDAPRVLAPAQWMPSAWRMGSGFELAAAPVDGAYQGVLIARRRGPRFTQLEVEELGLVAGIASKVRRVAPTTVP